MNTDNHNEDNLGGDDSKGELPQWMENKANMLEEMSQLVDLMTTEKDSMSSQIAVLTAKLEDARGQITRLDENKVRADEEKKRVRHELRDLKQKQKLESSRLKEALEVTKKELEEARSKLGLLSAELKKENSDKTQLSQTKQTLEARLAGVERSNAELLLTLNKGARERPKLTAQVSSLHEQCRALKAHNDQLRSGLTTSQQRCKQSQDEVLALKGRLTNTRRSNEQLQMKCSSLEQVLETLQSRSPTVVKVPTKSREEVRLAEECRRKDELLASCTREVFSCNSKNSRLQKELSNLQSQLSDEKRERLLLLSTLQTKERDWEDTCQDFKERMTLLTAKLKTKENQEGTLADVREGVEGRLRSIHSELTATRQELQQLKREVSQREESWTTERSQMEQDRDLLQRDLQTSREEVAELTRELESARRDHMTTVESLTTQWEGQLTEAREDYRRMKDASTKRCTELAKVVWRLKSELEQMSSQTQ